MTIDELLALYAPHWEDAPESTFYVLGDRDYLYRVSDVVVPRKCAVKFEDDHIIFAVFYGRNERYLGFALHVKDSTQKPFGAITEPQWIQIVDMTSTIHTEPEAIVDFALMRMLRFKTDGERGHSYILSTRRKDTCL